MSLAKRTRFAVAKWGAVRQERRQRTDKHVLGERALEEWKYINSKILDLDWNLCQGKHSKSGMAKKSPKERKTSMDSKNENVMCVNQRSGIRNSSNPSFLKNTATNPAPRSVYTPIPMIQNADEHDRGRRFTAINATENCQLFSLFPAIACIAPISSKNNSSCRIAHGTSPSPLPDLTQPYVLALALSAATA